MISHLIKAFWNRLQNVVYDIFTAHEKDGQLTGTASVGYYTETIQEVLKQTKTVDAVEVVHGRWEIITDDYDCEMMCCSVCRSEFYDGDKNYFIKTL